MQLISTYFSFIYIGLLLLTIAFYVCSKQKARRWVLLIFSYLFFYAVSGKLIIYLLLSTLSVHHFGLWLSEVQSEGKKQLKTVEKEQKQAASAKIQKKQDLIMAFAAILHIGILAVLKYSPFAAANINTVLRLLHVDHAVQIPEFLVPIGISFYTLQAVSYLFDVYRKTIPADRNLLRLALFMSFYPQIMEGPICRYSDTAESLWKAEKISYSNFVAGSQRIVFGIMKKLIVADRLNLFVEDVFLHYENYDGFVIVIAVVGYTLQLYMDFSGTMDVALGTAQIFGVKLPENFRRPLFSKTISEFWQRWHITLGTWLKDYIFYPVSMSKPVTKLTMRARKRFGNHAGSLIGGSIALFCVWIANGIWHGAGWHYIFFGMYHFAFILCGNIIQPTVIKTSQTLHIDRKSLPYRIMQIIRTDILVCIGELFFRAHGLRAGVAMFRKMFTDFTLETLRDGTLFTFGMDQKDYLVIGVFVIFLLVIGIIQEKGIVIRDRINSQNIALRLAIYYVVIMIIIIFGAYGRGYIPVDPIYANF